MISRTYGPIHFEDLEPHRFEDLCRELIYDYKEWYSIESTGRGGSDDGFDVRGYEKKYEIVDKEQTESVLDQGDVTQESYIDKGNLWMIQCKREKSITAAKIKKILEDVDEKNPPYGYMLIAPVDFTKKSYDAFTDGLRKKGVKEFYLWGKADLEHMLYLPKNDHILFAFFGISLVSKKRSKTTLGRSIIINKNKLIRMAGGGFDYYAKILLRDVNDQFYPYESEYKDFNEYPRWKVQNSYELHPLGLLFRCHKFYAYVNEENKTRDYISEVDLIEDYEDSVERNSLFELNKKHEQLWSFIPKKNRAYYVVDGLVAYKEMLLIDEKGDSHFDMPHIHIDLLPQKGFFPGHIHYIDVGGRQINISQYSKVEYFIKLNPPTPKLIKKKIDINPTLLELISRGTIDVIYDVDGKLKFLKVGNIINIKDDEYLQIIHIYETSINETDNPYLVSQLTGQPYEDVKGLQIKVYEYKRKRSRDIPDLLDNN